MMRAVLFDLDRTLVDLQTYTDYAAALADVEVLVGAWKDPPTPATDWDTPTQRCMSILVALSGDPRWTEVSDLITAHELQAIPLSHPMPRLAEAMVRTDHLPRAVVTLLSEEPARTALLRIMESTSQCWFRAAPTSVPSRLPTRSCRGLPVARCVPVRRSDDR